MRTCVGCRSRDARSALLRVVAFEGALVPDPSRRLAGRGANLHPVPSCLALAERRRAWSRVLRATGPLDAAQLSAYVRQQHEPAPANPPKPSDTGSRATRSDELSMSNPSR